MCTLCHDLKKGKCCRTVKFDFPYHTYFCSRLLIRAPNVIIESACSAADIDIDRSSDGRADDARDEEGAVDAGFWRPRPSWRGILPCESSISISATYW